MAFFDNTKRLLDAIPDVLLVKDIVRTPVGPRYYRWENLDSSAPALEAREEPELKVSLQKRRADLAAPGSAKKTIGSKNSRRTTKKAPRRAKKASAKRTAQPGSRNR
jgi:hypothetical protein